MVTFVLSVNAKQMSYSILDDAFGERLGWECVTQAPPPPRVIATGVAANGALAWPAARRNAIGSVYASPSTSSGRVLVTYPELLAYTLALTQSPSRQ